MQCTVRWRMDLGRGTSTSKATRSLDLSWRRLMMSVSRCLYFERRLHEPSDSWAQPREVADIPGQQNICLSLQRAMRNERVIDSRADYRSRRSKLKSRKIFALTKRYQSEPLLYLLHNVHSVRPSDAGPQREASERGVYFA